MRVMRKKTRLKLLRRNVVIFRITMVYYYLNRETIIVNLIYI